MSSFRARHYLKPEKIFQSQAEKKHFKEFQKFCELLDTSNYFSTLDAYNGLVQFNGKVLVLSEIYSKV